MKLIPQKQTYTVVTSSLDYDNKPDVTCTMNQQAVPQLPVVWTLNSRGLLPSILWNNELAEF